MSISVYYLHAMMLHRDCSISQLLKELSKAAAKTLSWRGFMSVFQPRRWRTSCCRLFPLSKTFFFSLVRKKNVTAAIWSLFHLWLLDLATWSSKSICVVLLKWNLNRPSRQILKDKRNRWTCQSCSKDNKMIGGGKSAFFFCTTGPKHFHTSEPPLCSVWAIGFISKQRYGGKCVAVFCFPESSFMDNSQEKIVTKSIIAFTAC